MQKVKQILSVSCFYVLPLLLMVIGVFADMLPYDKANELFAKFGSMAIMLLIGILFAKPLSVIFYRVKLLRYIIAFRRQLGVATFWLALFHGVLYIRLYELFNFTSFTQGENNFFLYGLVGLIGMSLLGITSNNFSVKKLGKNWKRLHFIAYPILLIALMHSSLVEGGPLKVYGVFGAFVLLKVLAHKGITFPSRKRAL